MRELSDLFAATEAVGNHDGIRPGGLNGGQQVLVGDGFRYFELIGFKAERASHAAAAGLDDFNAGSSAAQKRDSVSRAAEDRFAMAVAVDENLRSFEATRGEDKIGSTSSEPAGKEPDLFTEPLGSRMAGEELEQFVFENAGAAWLEKDEGQTGVDLGSQAVEDLREIRACGGEETEVVERSSTAEVAWRNLDVEAGLSENGFGGNKSLRVVIVVPGVGPKENRMRRDGAITRYCRSPAWLSCFPKTLWGEARNLTLMCQPGDALDEWASQRACKQEVGERRGERAVAGEPIGEAEDVVVERVKAAFVTLSQELGFVGCHVDLDRTLRLTCLAAKTEVQGFVDGPALKAFVTESAGEHLP